MTQPIYIYGNDVLHKKVENLTPHQDITAIVKNMFDTMYKAEGVGLAAPQIGQSISLFVIDTDELSDEYPEAKGVKMVFANAEIVEYSQETWTYKEGCLSLPDFREDIVRPSKIKIHYFDEAWNEYEKEFDGIIARVIQHEYDHIQGKTMVDRLSPLRRQLVKPKLLKRFRQGVSTQYAAINPK